MRRSQVNHPLDVIFEQSLCVNGLQSGGEGGIRTQQDSLDSASYRFHNARLAVNAGDAVAPCTLLHGGRGCVRALCASTRVAAQYRSGPSAAPLCGLMRMWLDLPPTRPATPWPRPPGYRKRPFTQEQVRGGVVAKLALAMGGLGSQRIPAVEASGRQQARQSR